MKQKEVTQALVNYFKTDQWRELMRQLTQTEEELYHTHVYVHNSIEAYSICKLLKGYSYLLCPGKEESYRKDAQGICCHHYNPVHNLKLILLPPFSCQVL